MEKVVRKHLNSQEVHSYIPETDLHNKIKQEVVKSIELLTVITDLWITIQVHSLPRSGV